MGDRDREGQGGCRGGEHLEAVAQDHQQVGTRACVYLSEAHHADAHGLGDPLRRVGREEHLHPLGHREARTRDLIDRGAELRGEVHARRDELQVELWSLLDAPQDLPVDAEVRPCDGDDRDGPHARSSHESSVSAGMA